MPSPPARRRRSPAVLTALVALVALAATACGASTGRVDQDALRRPSVAPDTLVYGHQQEPPCVYGGWIEQAYLSEQILDTLVARADDGSLRPQLAESWTTSPDGLTWTFTLRQGPTFSDGTPVDAAAVAYNVDWWLKGGNSTVKAWIGEYYAGAQPIDPRTVAIHLTAPYPRLAENMTQPYFGIQSARALKTRTSAQNCSAPIGSGPFVVRRWNRGADILLDRRDDYAWAPENASHQGPAYLAHIDWRFITDPTTRTAALRAGEVDAIYDVQAFEWANLRAQGYQLQSYVTGGRPQQISFNTARGPFVDERVRQAFAYGLDREGVVDAVGKGVIPYEGNGPVSRSTPGYDAQDAGRYTHDPARAAALLDAAGWRAGPDGVRTKDGRPLDITFPYAVNRTINQDGVAIIQALQQQAQAVGFRVRLVPFPPSAAAAGAYTGRNDYDLQIGYWTAVNAGILWVNWRQDLPNDKNPANSAFLNDPALEGLIRAANSEPDPARQTEEYQAAQHDIAEHAYSIGVYDRLSTLAIKPTLVGVRQEQSQGGPIFYDARFA